MISEKYPLLYRYLALFTLENGLDLQQIKRIVADAKASNPEFADEVSSALADESLSWQEIFDDPVLGEIYSTDSEKSAFDYAQQMFNS